ncbi:hypothetical protein AWB77_06538 [Caballeronia fortuita]|uniref:Uncharacterized protein n=1 Tax=Caballeronia fortuita TaxID=1777138 RepID=A0A158E6P5_9BURK|nr:hypothetical protein AWB77_06538 [Caballeronia fortuita]
MTTQAADDDPFRRIAQLEQENVALREVNDILRKAVAFYKPMFEREMASQRRLTQDAQDAQPSPRLFCSATKSRSNSPCAATTSCCAANCVRCASSRSMSVDTPAV